MSREKELFLWAAMMIVIPALIIFVVLYINDYSYFPLLDAIRGVLYSVPGFLLLLTFSTTLLLGVRPLFLESRFGLPSLLRVHRFAAYLCLCLILLHGGFFLKKEISLQWLSGVVAGGFALLLGLITTFFMVPSRFKLNRFTRKHPIITRYSRLKLLHNFFALFLSIGFFHALLSDFVRHNKIILFIVCLHSLTSLTLFVRYRFRLYRSHKKLGWSLTQKRELTTNMVELTLKSPTTIKPSQSFKPGQFIDLALREGEFKSEYHPYSLTYVDETSIKIIAKEIGPFSQNLKSLANETIFSVMGPYGHFFLPKRNETRDETLLCFASGVGITPFLGMLQTLEERKDEKLFLVWMSRETSFFDRERLEKLKQENSGFDYRLVNVLPGKKLGETPEITTLFEEKSGPVYTCGGREFTQEISQLAKGHKLPHFHESFT